MKTCFFTKANGRKNTFLKKVFFFYFSVICWKSFVFYVFGAKKVFSFSKSFIQKDFQEKQLQSFKFRKKKKKVKKYKENLSVLGWPILTAVISYNMKKMTQRNIVCDAFTNHMEIIDAQFLSSASKPWVYNNYLISFLTWPFIIYDFTLTFGSELTKIVNMYLKKLLKINKPASTGFLYIPEAWLKLKTPKILLQSLEISKSLILANSGILLWGLSRKPKWQKPLTVAIKYGDSNLTF